MQHLTTFSGTFPITQINYAQYQDDIAFDFENPLHRPSRFDAYWFVYLPLVSYGFIQYLNQKVVKPFPLLPICSSKIKLMTVTSGDFDRTIYYLG
ncbi:hypothetical protein MP228_003295 [Amoeboaphelidium protococcarum]|nr:hypothetical protein MP228_003295 [Amoeboaphelidium protococcarum]